MTGTVGNADRWRARFLGANDVPSAPDGNVTWTVYDARGNEIEGAGREQPKDEMTEDSWFEFVYVPTTPQSYRVKASADVGGVPQASDAVLRRVVP